MADPATLMVVGAVVGGAGMGTQMFGEYQAGQYAYHAASVNAKADKQIAEYNASIINMQAAYEASMARSTGQAMSAMTKAKAMADSANLTANAQIANNNAQAAAANAAMAREQAQFNADKIRQRNRIVKGKQVAAFGKAGVTLQGSAKDVMYDSAVNGEIDALVALYTGNVAATQYENVRRNKKYEAGILTAQADITNQIGEAQANWYEYQGEVSSILSLWEGNQKSGLTLMESNLRQNIMLMEGRQARTASFFRMAGVGAQGGGQMAMLAGLM